MATPQKASASCRRCQATIVRPPRHPGPLPRVCETCRAADALLARAGRPVSDSPKVRAVQASRRAEAEAPSPLLSRLDSILRDVERRVARIESVTGPLLPRRGPA